MFIRCHDEFELEYKILYKNGDMFMCDPDTNEFSDLDRQQCWRLPYIEEGSLR